MATDRRVTGIHNVMTGKRFADRWQVLEAIGSGGMGVVYRGWDLKLKSHVAIKVLNPELRSDPSVVKRFAEEVDTLKRSAHPNIATIHDFSEDDVIYLVLEFLDGPILKEVLDKSPERRLHLQRVRRIFTQILDALAVVHERGIIHRDLKPENVFVLRLGSGRGNTDVIKLIDFGIAKFRGGPQAARPGLTQAGMVLGTPYYMSPEQCRGETNVDNRTDLYAVGVMLYEAVTGRLPFDKPTHPEIMTAHLKECPDAPGMLNQEIPPELEIVILRALTKDADKRFQDALEFSEALDEAIPEDPMFYRDSQRVSPINGRAVAAPPRVPTMAEEDRPTSPQSDDVSKTPTRLLGGGRPPAGLALAKTITPADLRREAAKAKVDAAMQAAMQVAKNFGVWIQKPSRRATVISIGITILAVITLILLAVLLSNSSRHMKTADAGTTVAVTDAEVPSPPVEQTDILVIRAPVPVPADAIKSEPAEDVCTAEVEASEADAGEGEARTEATEAEVANPPTPPVGYADLLAEGTVAFGRRNWRLAARRFTRATELWPEGADAWRGLGDALLLLGKRPEAKVAFQKYLRLAPKAPDASYYRGIVGRQ